MEDYLKGVSVPLLQKNLLEWYGLVKRDLPWRQTKDPYRILVSEIMLQQTQVATVIPYYNRFLEWFPTTHELAAADEGRLLKAWEGLGYYSRAKNLQSAAKMIVEAGGFPTNPSDILSLKGVGPYTAGAVGSIAFGLAVPAVDGNVFRVLSRLLLIYEDIAKAKTRRIFEHAAQGLIPLGAPGEFNQALMELGATICRPKSPKCLECPLKSHCRAFESGCDEQLPVKTKAAKQKKVPLIVAVVENQYGQILLHQRPPTGLLANFYQFPHYPYEGAMEPSRLLEEELSSAGMDIQSVTPIGTFKHVFSHLVWEMEAYRINVHQRVVEEGDAHAFWAPAENLSDYSLVAAHQKIVAG